MVTDAQDNYVFSCRRALEALRNGVPNREAVHFLDCQQPAATNRFNELLRRAADRDNPPSGAAGLLVSGDFGSGKSHLLTYLEDQALAQNFVCSKVAISKETPFYNLEEVFKAAVRAGTMPNRRGRLIEELALQLAGDSERYTSFFNWVKDAAASQRLSPIFPASLLVHMQAGEPQWNQEIENFWAGEKVGRITPLINAGLRDLGQRKNYPFRMPKVAELHPQRLRFFVELIKAAGYAGWVVLLDELELVAAYSLLQRGRSYSELSRWLGQTAGTAYPGLVVVGTVTDDFALEIIHPDGKKKDRDYVGARLQGRYPDLVAPAETGMRLLERECTPLTPPSDAEAQKAVAKLREIYSAAYGWPAPELPAEAGGAGYQNRMRYKVRAAINQWDLLRLYPNARPETQFHEFRHTYEENRDLERESKDEDGDTE